MRSRRVSFLPALIFSAVAALVLAGCSDDGDTGPAGPAGPPGPSGSSGTTDASSGLNVVIDSVDVGPPTVVTFTMTTGHGLPFVGFQASQGRFMIAQLVAGTDGTSGRWQSYINSVEEAGGAGPGTENQVQATAENSGTLVDNGDGTYTYTFDTDITNVTSPVAVPYNASATHRVSIELRGGLPGFNALYNFQPSTNSTSGINTRTIVKLESCNTCHGTLALHGNGRFETEQCVVCHNPGSTDANSGNTVDFAVMIHKIHLGVNLPSVVGGTDYVIYGNNDTPHNYSSVVFPQNTANCTTCHDPADPETPDAGNIAAYPSTAACGACHDDVNFATGAGHSSGIVATDNSECVSCHVSGGMAGDILEDHLIETKVAAAGFQFNIIDIDYVVPNVTVTFSVTDPTNGNAAYNILTDPEFNSGGASTLNILVAWDTDDYHNEGSGGAPARVVSISAANGGGGGVTAIGGGQYTVSVALPVEAQSLGSGTVAIEGHPAADPDGNLVYDLRVPVTGVVDHFAITDPAPVPRREVVELAKCQACHGVNDGLSLHGANRTDNLVLCAMCHNPNATDIAQRPSDPDGTVNQTNANATGGAEEQTIEFKHMIHAIHGAEVRSNDFIVFGRNNTAHDYGAAEFPRSAADCDACHTSDGFELPPADGVLGTTVRTQGTVNVANNNGTQDFLPSLAVVLDPADDSNISPMSSACSSCHDSALAQAHMEQNGGVFLETQANINAGINGIETCAVCHGPGRDADVATVHGLD